MKTLILFSFLIFSFFSFSQIASDSSSFDTLKKYHLELDELLNIHENLTKDQKSMFSNKCAEAVPYYRYVSIKEIVSKDSLEKYDISKICKKHQGLEVVEKLKVAQESLKKDKDKFEIMLDSLKRVKDNDNFKAVTLKLNELKESINSQCDMVNDQLVSVKKMEFIKEEEINELDYSFCEEFTRVQAEEIKTKNFIIVGNGDPISTDSLFKIQTAQNFYNEVIGAESTTQLGTFEIPADLSRIKLYVYAKRDMKLCHLNKFNEKFIEVRDFLTLYNNSKKKSAKKNRSKKERQVAAEIIGSKDCLLKDKGLSKSLDALFELSGLQKNSGANSLAEIPNEVLFRSIAFEMLDGGLVDIRLEVIDLKKKVKMYFESRAPVSLLNYTRRSSYAFLHFSNIFSEFDDNQKWKQIVLKHLRIRVSDVLKYAPDAGNNYVPNDLTLTLPKDIVNEREESATRAYKLINDSSLKNIMDLRTYTDFLGLFGNESNGLFQIEGKADFYINPFNFDRTSLYIFKKVTPFIRYSRLEKGNDFVETKPLDDSNQIEFKHGSLELLQKSNLEFGFDLNLVNFRIFKESPVWFSFHTPVNLYNTSIRPLDVSSPDDEIINEELAENTTTNENDFNFNAVGYGLGLNLEVKRRQNFGFNLGASFKWYTFLGDYSQFNLRELDNLKTYSLDAEIFYYPGKNESQSIFLRMRTFRDIGSGDSAFQQIQLGYRFTLGAGKIKARD